MENSFRFIGQWWLPEDAENKVAGELFYAPEEQITLSLNGQFEDENEKHDIILGITSEGKKITLYKCIQILKSTSIPGYVVENYLVKICFIGRVRV